MGVPLRHHGGVSRARFSPDGRSVLTSSVDRTARLWDAVTAAPISPPLLHQDVVLAVDWNRTGTIVASASLDNTARLWDAVTGKPLGPPLPHQGAVQTVCFAGDGRSVLTGSQDGAARLWPVPAPLEGTVEQISLWTRLVTGLELERDGSIAVLDSQAWHECRKRLAQLGGSPWRQEAGDRCAPR